MKKSRLCLCALAAIGCAGVISAAVFNGNTLLTTKASEEPFTFTLNAANGLTSAEQTAGTFSRETALGNTVLFAHTGAQPWGGSGFFQTRGNGSGIWNTTALTGMKSIKIKADNAKTYSILFGNEAGEYIYSSGDITGTGAVQEYAVPQYETPFAFFKLQSTNAAWMHYTSVEVVYSCSNTLANRGQTFTPTGGGTYDFAEAVDVATGTINVDINWTDLGADNGKTAIGFFDQGWANSFGYKTVKANSKTGDVAGLTVVKLSDGYTRFSWKLSEMTGSGTLPTSILTVHVRNNSDWTTSFGYFDVNTASSAVELKGKEFTAAGGLTVNLASPVAVATGKIQIDLYFTTKGKATIAIMDDWNGNHYGYFDIKPTGNNAEIYGLQVVSQANGFVRITFEASKIGASKKQGTPANIKMVYIRARSADGGYTTANGYINVTVL